MARPGFFAVDSLSGMHILLVAEDPGAGEEVARVLRYCGALVTLAESDEEAARVLDVVKPDLIVITIRHVHHGELVIARIIRPRKPEAGGVMPIVAILPAGQSLPAESGVTVQLNFPLNAWTICEALSRLIPNR